MSDSRSYWACRLSIQYLFRPASERLLEQQAEFGENPLPREFDLPAPEFCYLWTLTFPDALTRGDPRLAMKCWDSFGRWLRKTGKLGVRALERGEKGAFHFHVATPQRWDAAEMWEMGERYGFGRVNVRERPVDRAKYIAKYIGKAAGREWLPLRMRQWACFGFKGVSQLNVKRREKTRVLIPDAYDGKLFTVLEWVVDDAVAFTRRIRTAVEGAEEITKTMEIKPAAAKEIVNRLVNGVLCAIGEFRGATVRSQSMEDYKTKQQVERVLVECSVEIAGMATTVTEWTKPGTKLADVKSPPVSRGDAVMIEIETVKWYKGAKTISGTIRPLPALV